MDTMFAMTTRPEYSRTRTRDPTCISHAWMIADCGVAIPDYLAAPTVNTRCTRGILRDRITSNFLHEGPGRLGSLSAGNQAAFLIPVKRLLTGRWIPKVNPRWIRKVHLAKLKPASHGPEGGSVSR